MYRQCMTAIVHLMLPPFVPDVTIHVDSLEIYMCISSYQALSQGGFPPPPPPSLPGFDASLPPLLVTVLIKMH